MRLSLIKTTYPLFCILFLSSPLQGQGVMIGNNPADRLLIMKKATIPNTDISDIEGSMYVRDSFIHGIVATDKDTFYNLPMKYNVYEDVIEFQYKDEIHILEPATNIKKIQIDQMILTVEPYEFAGKIKTGFFPELAGGKIKFLSKKVTEFQEMQLAKAMKYTNTPAKFIAQPDQFYTRIGNLPAAPITKLKKTLVLFPDHQKSVISYAGRRKLSVKKQDLVALWTYYNSLD